MRSDAAAWCQAPAWRLAELIRRGEVSPVEVVDAHVARARAVNPRLNALVAERFDDARRDAVAAEAAVRAATDRAALPPLLGVPITLKEFLAQVGVPHTAGLVWRRGMRATRDALVVQRMRAAGAIALGTSNVPEAGMWMETYNPLYGRTSNPWDVARTPGGSSGGEAALVAAGASALGVGSDIAGSVRIPSAMCGIVGHKPSERLVPNDGHWPESDGASDSDRMLCIGPMGRCVRDLELALEVMAGGLPAADPALAAGDLRGVRVFPVTTTARVRIAPVMQAAVDRAAAALADRGAEVTPLDDATWRRVFGRSVGGWLRALAEAGAEFGDLVTGGQPLDLLGELWQIARGRPRYAAATLGLVALERMPRRLEQLTLRGAPSVAELQAALEDALGPRGVLLHPPYSRPAPRHRWPMLTPFDAVCTALFSVTGSPGTVVPVGFDADHLPVAVQVVARRGNDRLTLATAAALEQAFGGWVPAPA